MSSRGFTPPDEPDEPDALLSDADDGGEPDTRDDEMARDDAPEQAWEDDSDG